MSKQTTMLLLLALGALVVWYILSENEKEDEDQRIGYTGGGWDIDYTFG